jgi:hypothetical protein
MIDVKDLYVSIPKRETNDITRTQLITNNDIQTNNQIITLLEINPGQNYFSFQGQIYQLDKGETMGSPISGTITEIFLQQLEKTNIKHIIDSKNLIFYTRYIDAILIVYNCTRITPKCIVQYIDTVHNNIQLNPTQETNGNICFMDPSTTRKPTCLEIDIHRKPTATDTTINFLSNCPLEHKLAAYRFLIRRILTLPLREEQRQKEWKNILQIAHNNIPMHLLIRQKQRIQRRITQPKTPQLLEPTQNGQPSHTPLHNSGRSPSFSNTPT